MAAQIGVECLGLATAGLLDEAARHGISIAQTWLGRVIGNFCSR